MRFARALALIAACALGCHKYLGIRPPEPSSPMASAILFFEQGATVRAWATDLDAGSVRLPQISIPAEIDVEVFYYACSVSAFGLSPGWLSISNGGVQGVPIPHPLEMQRATLAPDHASTWAKEATTSLLPDWRLTTSLQCATFNVKEWPIGPPADGTIDIPLDAHSALVATDNGAFFRVRDDADQPQALTAVSTATPDLAGYRAHDGRIWLFGVGGEIAVGDPDRGFTSAGTTASATATTGFAAMDGPEGDAPFELFTVSQNGSFDHYDGSAWHTLDRGGLGAGDHPGLVWVGPGEVFAIGLLEGSVTHVKDGVLTREHIGALETNLRLLSISSSHQLGIILGTLDGTIFVRHDDGSWDPLPNVLRNEVQTLTPYQGGFIAGVEHGVLVQYHPVLGWCPYSSAATTDPRHVVPFASGFLMTTAQHERIAQGASVFYAESDQPSSSCFDTSPRPP
jgi:hypothetical protein